MKFATPKTAIFGQLGYVNRNSVNEGNDYPDDSFFVDIGVDRIIGENGFIGGGFGLWNADNHDFIDESYFIHGGKNLGQSNVQLYAEGRVFGNDRASSNNMISIGVRYLFK